MDIKTELLDDYLTVPSMERERKVHWYIECFDHINFRDMSCKDIKKGFSRRLIVVQ